MAGKRSIRAEKTPPRKNKSDQQMVDIRGLPLSTEQGTPLVTEKDSYRRSEYGQNSSPSVVVDSDSYRGDGLSTANQFSKGRPAALPIIERFAEQSEVSRSLLGIDRQTTQQGLFSNVSSYGLDPKDWRVDGFSEDGNNSNRFWWTRRPSATGNYYPFRFGEDSKNSAIVISSNPTPFLEPPRPSIQDQLLNPGGAERYRSWGQYLNSIVALYLFRYMVDNLPETDWERFNLLYLLDKYPPLRDGSGTPSFNELYWDKIWLDIGQNRFGPISNYPIVPNGKAFNFNNVEIGNFRSTALWGSPGVIITEADSILPGIMPASWDSFFFGSTRVYYPDGLSEDRGHFRIKTNPVAEVWEKYFGLRWDDIRQDLKDWEFTIHPNPSTVTQVEKDLKLPYFVLDTPLVPDRLNNVFSTTWPSPLFGEEIDLPTDGNRIGGRQGIRSEITLKSIRAFRYQPGRISGFTYGVKVSEIGAGPGTTLEFGIENDTDSYMFRLSNGANFSVIRRSTVPLEETVFLQDSGYAENTRTIVRNGRVQYETVIEQKIMNGDPLSGEGETGYILDPDTVTMYKIEFGWYGAIGARFYAYVPVSNDECRWVTMHTLVIENQLGRPCLADPFFYFKYRLDVQDSSTIRIDQYVNKFGASYYIDGYDEGTLYSLNAQSRVRNLRNPGFSVSKTQLNAIDWTTLMGIKPRQSLVNRFGTEIYNKKEIFPEKVFIISQQDCEIKIVRQKGCPEWAYTHHEGYRWLGLPEERRLKAKFTVNPYFEGDLPELGISADDASSHTAVIGYSVPSTGDWRDPRISSNWEVADGQVIRLLGDDLYALSPSGQRSFASGSVALKLFRDGERNSYLSSRKPIPIDKTNVYLPFTYAPIAPYTQGYDIEFDYFRRDQILLSTVDVLSDEFFIYFVGGGLNSVVPTNHKSSLRFGFAWPNTTDTGSPIYAESFDPNWGIESNSGYDGQNFYEGVPYDFVSDYGSNCLYYETSPTLVTDLFNLESGEFGNLFHTRLFEDGNDRLSVPGAEGGLCRGLFCKAGRELRTGVQIIEEIDPNTSQSSFFISDPLTPWPSLGKIFTVTVVQGSTVINLETTGGITRVIDDVTLFLLPLNSLNGLSLGSVSVSYSVVYIASMNKRSEVRRILVSDIAPGNVPFIRVFIQGRQGAQLGGVWVGQKTANGIRVDPLTPHRSTVSISDTGTDFHSQWSSDPQSDGTLKSIRTFTHPDPLGLSTAPTFNASEANLDSFKSFHTNPRKCGSFLSPGGVNAAGIYTASDYPIRWTTFPQQATPLATYYVSANQPTEIDLRTVFNVSAEAIVNEDDGNLATFFVARALGNHDESQNEIYMSLNYSEQ